MQEARSSDITEAIRIKAGYKEVREMNKTFLECPCKSYISGKKIKPS